MSSAGVLAAAAALRRFTAAELAAYCPEDDEAIAAVLTQHPSLVERLPSGEWQVRDTVALRARLARQARLRQARRRQLAHTPLSVRPPDPTRAAARMLLAEQVLLDCAAEPDPAARRIMAATAHNHLRQCAAAFTPQAGSWWEIDPSATLAVPRIRLDADLITAGRLRMDLTLAVITGSEAAGATVAMDDLVRAATQVDGLPAEMPSGRRRALVRRFTSLSCRVLRLPHGSLSQSAPARFLATVAIRRTADRATESLHLPPARPTADLERGGDLLAVRAFPQVDGGHADGSAHLIRLLTGLAEEPAVRGGGEGPASRLFRVIDRLPAGRARIAVYADLVALLPRDCHWDVHRDLLPGAVVECVADNRAQQHLWDCARLLENDLTRSPFSSESALIGQAAYVLEHLAAVHADLDSGLRYRADANRRSLLTLAGVPVQ
jgi:hypothetical protein